MAYTEHPRSAGRLSGMWGPLLALAVVVAARFAPPQHSARRRFAALLLVECALLSLLGALLLFLPEVAATIWPWALPRDRIT